MPSILPYYEFYHRDWLSSSTVAQMSMAAQGIYHALLNYQWEDEKLPADPSRLARICRATPEEWEQFSEFLEQCFPVCDDGFRRNTRMAAQRVGVLARVETLRANGAKGGRPKPAPEETKRKPKGFDSDNQNETKRKAISDTDTDTDIIPPSPKGESPPLPTPDPFWFERGGDPPRVPDWWERGDGDHLAKAVAVAIRTAKGYAKHEPSQLRVCSLVQFARGFMPDEQAFRDVLENFVNRAATKRKPEYSDPVGALLNWVKRAEPEWRRIKRQRQIDAEMAARRGGLAQSADQPPRKVAVLEPVEGRDFETREVGMKTALNGKLIPDRRKFTLGTDREFDEDEWRAAQQSDVEIDIVDQLAKRKEMLA